MWLDARLRLEVVGQDRLPEPDPGGRAALVWVGAGAGTGPDAAGWALRRGCALEADGHRPGCACGACGGRSALATLLGVLFMQRARGSVAMFDRVVVAVLPGAERTILRDLRADALVAGRFRLDEPAGLAEN